MRSVLRNLLRGIAARPAEGPLPAVQQQAVPAAVGGERRRSADSGPLQEVLTHQAELGLLLTEYRRDPQEFLPASALRLAAAALLFTSLVSVLLLGFMFVYGGSSGATEVFVLAGSAIGCMLCALALTRLPQLHPVAGAAFGLTLQVTLTAMLLVYLARENQDMQMMVLAVSSPWIPLIYIGLFLLCRLPLAMAVSVPIMISLCIASIASVDLDGPIRQRLLSTLFNLVLAQFITVLLLTCFETMRRAHTRTELRLASIAHNACTDAMTQLYNRRCTTLRINQLLEQMAVGIEQRPACAVMMDIDHFKRINDQHGHLVGDQVIRQMGELLQERVRATDTVGRWGGEEFVIVCRNCSDQHATLLVSRLRDAIARSHWPMGAPVTASFGISAIVATDTVDSIMERTDLALYRAKERGRDRFEIEPHHPKEPLREATSHA